MAARTTLKALYWSGLSLLVLWVSFYHPEGSPASNGQTSGAFASEPRDVRYTIKFFPGYTYMPGTTPFGIGEPVHAMNDVVQAFEKLFPDTRIELVNVPSTRGYLITQLSSGQAPDIIQTTIEDLWPDVHKGWYIPLDAFLKAPNQFIRQQGDPNRPGFNQWWDQFRYQAATRRKAAPDGRTYSISYDMAEAALYYNKTLFRTIGVDVPATWEEFIEVLDKIKKYRTPDGKSVVPLLTHIDTLNCWGQDMFFDQLYYSLLPGIDVSQGDPTRDKYLPGYLDWNELVFLHDKGFFTERDPRFPEYWKIMHHLAQFCNQDLVTPDRVRTFVTQRGAILWETTSFAYRLSADPELPFEWGLFYLPPFTQRTSQYATGHPMCAIGGTATMYEVTNTAINDTDPQTPFEERIRQSQRLQRVIAFLQFLTLPENCDKVVNEKSVFLSNVIGVEVAKPLKPFEQILERRYTMTKWIWTFGLMFGDVQRRMLTLYLADNITLDEFLSRWQIPNIDAACARANKRADYDPDALEKQWEQLAPAREHMEGLPK